jgi:hypothetical protein
MSINIDLITPDSSVASQRTKINNNFQNLKDGVESGVYGVMGPQGPQGPPGPQGIQGEPGLKYQGLWSSAPTYDVGDVVEYNGTSYVAIVSHANIEPPNASYWGVLASKGDAGPAGTSGSQILSSPLSSRPTSTTTNNLWLASDVGIMSRYNGSDWEDYQIGPRTYLPSKQTFSWLNQGSCTVTTNGYSTMYIPPQTTTNFRYLAKPLPPTPYKIRTRISVLMDFDNYIKAVALAIIDSVSTKHTYIGISNENNGSYEIQRYSSYSTSDTSLWSNMVHSYYGHNFLNTVFELGDDGTTLTWKISIDGVIFQQVYQETRSAYMTSPTHVGWGGVQTSNKIQYISLLSWQEIT